MNDLLKTIGNNVRQIRKEKGVKGETLGKELGVTKGAISNLENGLVDLKVSTLEKIAKVLEIEVVSLFETNKEIDAKEFKLSNYPEHINKHIRIIDILVCRIEYMNEQIECLRMRNSG